MSGLICICLFRFIKHYEGRRAPFVIIVNPVLVQKPDLLDGIIEFVEYAIGAFPVSSLIVVQISPSTYPTHFPIRHSHVVMALSCETNYMFATTLTKFTNTSCIWSQEHGCSFH